MRRSCRLFTARLAQYDSNLRVTIKPHWGDMDAFNHINNVMYMRYFETARIAYIGDSSWLTGNVKPIIKSIHINYLKQCAFPCTLELYTCTTEIRPKGMSIATLFVNEKGEPVAEAKAAVLSFDFAAGKVVEMPRSVVDFVNKIDVFQLDEVKDRLKKMS